MEAKRTESQEKTLQMAANLLQYRQRSAQALFDRLLEKGAEETDAAFAVAKLQQLGFLNDVEYARLVVRDLSARGYGPGRIRQALYEKKADKSAIETAMEDYVPDSSRLQTYIASKLQGKTPDRRLLKKVSDGLFRRGFSWEEIRSALRAYEDQMEDEE